MLALGAGACAHPIDDGTWRVDREGAGAQTDTCGLLPAGATLGEGRLVVTGVEARLGISPPGVVPVMPMAGRFKSSVEGQPDEFALDGSISDEPVTVGGVACRVEFGQVRLEATVRDRRSFTGTLDSHYELASGVDPACPASCDLRADVRGTWLSP